MYNNVNKYKMPIFDNLLEALERRRNNFLIIQI